MKRTRTWQVLAVGAFLVSAIPLMADQTLDPQLARALEVHARHISSLLEMPGVLGGEVGVSATDPHQPVIRLYFHKKAPPGLKANLPTELEGIPVEILEIERPTAQ